MKKLNEIKGLRADSSASPNTRRTDLQSVPFNHSGTSPSHQAATKAPENKGFPLHGASPGEAPLVTDFACSASVLLQNCYSPQVFPGRSQVQQGRTKGRAPVTVNGLTSPSLKPRRVRIVGAVAYLRLSDGTRALIDADRAADLGRFNWSADHRPGREHVEIVTMARAADGRPTKLRLHHAVMPPVAGLIVDHVNGDTRDNRRCNLRHATLQENARNAGKKSSAASSRFRGVYLDRGRFRAQIRIDGARLALGRFATEAEAARAYDAAAVKHHGAFARTNEALGLL